jgi:hypothetical protein
MIAYTEVYLNVRVGTIIIKYSNNGEPASKREQSLADQPIKGRLDKG